MGVTGGAAELAEFVAAKGVAYACTQQEGGLGQVVVVVVVMVVVVVVVVVVVMVVVEMEVVEEEE